MTGLRYSLISLLVAIPVPLLANDLPKFEYPNEVIRTFLRGCEINPNNSKEFCSCSLEGLQQKYSFADFTKLDAEVRTNRQVPAEVQAIFGKCRQSATPPAQ